MGFIELSFSSKIKIDKGVSASDDLEIKVLNMS